MADTTAEPTMSAQELTVKLAQLKASATQQYSLKNYSAAAEFYSEAAELQDQVNGEMSPDNADLLYQYGRCLYHVAVSNSDVLGGKVASSEEPKRKKRKVAKSESSAAGAADGRVIGDAMKDGEQKLAEEVAEAVVDKKGGVKSEEPTVSSKPFFQITGDENWTDSEEEDEADAEAEEQEDDFETAYEILDMARVLLRKKLEASQLQAGKSTTELPEVRLLKERLADTHDLQAEISLENERFQDAVNDTRDSLALKLDLYPTESNLVAEAHFKLSLALEFASVTSTSDGNDENQETQVDEGLRQEAAKEMEKAIASCQLRISKEEASANAMDDKSKAEEVKKSSADVKEIVADMEQRLLDLRNPAASLAGAPDGEDELKGMLGEMLGASKGEQQKKVAQATAQANDLSGLVKHRKKAKVEEAAKSTNSAVAGSEGKGKRKADEVGDGQAVNGKKARFEDDA